MNLLAYCTHSAGEVLKEFGTTRDKGLSSKAVVKLQQEYGFNEIKGQETTWYHIFFRQWRSPFIYLLLVAALIAFLATGDYVEGTLILIIVVVNSLMGFFQEYKAAQTLQLLRSYIISHEKVLRNGKRVSVTTRELVPGDLVFLHPGDSIPADIRLIESRALLIDESPLSGEAIPVQKTDEALSQEPKSFHQATNFCFAGTSVVGGNGLGVVVATGTKTNLGGIAKLIQETTRESTFAKNIHTLSKFIIFMVIITLSIVVVAHLLLQSEIFLDVKFLVFIIALAVTIIPELLPTILTFCLSQGAQILARSKVIVKRLSAIEDLGSIQVLCTDKTGTLTENKLVVANVFSEDKEKALFYASLLTPSTKTALKKHPNSAFDDALLASLSPQERKQLKEYAFVADVPFEPARRRSSAVQKKGSKYVLIVRGAYEELEKTAKKLDEKKKVAIAQWVEEEGVKGRRVIAVSKKEISVKDLSDLKAAEKDLDFLGIVSLEDPIKKSTFKAIQEAQVLGVRVKILTGDSPEVAGYVGKEIGITTEMDDVITGDSFAELPEAKKREVALKYAVFARIAPTQKYEIIKLLQEKYEVGFLGDGINDAPALKIANVALVVQGASDIAQEAADIILLKKSLYVIIVGIKEGRKIFVNTIKYLRVSIASNFGNVYGLSFASMVISYLPMLPIQLLFANIFSDFPMLGVATDNVADEELREPGAYNIKDIAFLSVVLGMVSTLFDFIFFATFYRANQPAVLQTSWFVGSILTELLFVISIRNTGLFFSRPYPSPGLLIGLVLTSIMTLLLPYTTLGQRFLHFIPLSQTNILTILGISCIYLIVNEMVKLLYYKIMFRAKKAPGK